MYSGDVACEGELDQINLLCCG